MIASRIRSPVLTPVLLAIIAVSASSSGRIEIDSLKKNYEFGIFFDAKGDVLAAADVRGNCTDDDVWGCDGIVRMFDIRGDALDETAQLVLPDRLRPTGIALADENRLAVRFFDRIVLYARTRSGWTATGGLSIEDRCANGVFRDLDFDGTTVVVAGWDVFCLYEQRGGSWRIAGRFPLAGRRVPRIVAGRLAVWSSSHMIDLYEKRTGEWGVVSRLESADHLDHEIAMSKRWIAVPASSTIDVFDLEALSQPPTRLPVDSLPMQLSVSDAFIVTNDASVFARAGAAWKRAEIDSSDEVGTGFHAVAANRLWVGRPRDDRRQGSGHIYGHPLPSTP